MMSCMVCSSFSLPCRSFQLYSPACFVCFVSLTDVLCISQFQLRPCPPPRANPRALAFFSSWMANSPGVGTRGWGHLSYQMPRCGDGGRGQMPRPGTVRPQSTLQQFSFSLHNYATFSIKCEIFCFCRPAFPSSIVCNGTI